MPSVANYISKAAPTDNYPVVHDVDMLGGYRVVADLVERDAIVSNQRKEGMLCYVISDSQTYKLGAGLTNLDWTIFTSSGGLTPTAIQTANYTANANELVLCDTSGGGFTLTLPLSPANGEKVGILDVTNSFSESNPLTIDPGTNEIIGTVDTFDVTIGRSAITFMAINDGVNPIGWHILDSIPNLGGSEDLVYAIAKNNASNTVSNSLPFRWDNVIVDTHNAITTGANWKFTAPKAGLYSFSGSYDHGVTQAFHLYKNGAYEYYLLYHSFGNTPYNFAGQIYLNQGDYIDVRMDGGTATSGSSTTFFFAIHLVLPTANIRGTANLDYSNLEINTNQLWIDGKPIYRKVFSATSANNSAQQITHGITGLYQMMPTSSVVYYSGSSSYKRSNSFELELASNANSYFTVDTTGFTGAWTVVVVFEYTKV